MTQMGFLVAQMEKKLLTCNLGDMGSIPESGILLKKGGFSVFLRLEIPCTEEPGELHGSQTDEYH